MNFHEYVAMVPIWVLVIALIGGICALIVTRSAKAAKTAKAAERAELVIPERQSLIDQFNQERNALKWREQQGHAEHVTRKIIASIREGKINPDDKLHHSNAYPYDPQVADRLTKAFASRGWKITFCPLPGGYEVYMEGPAPDAPPATNISRPPRNRIQVLDFPYPSGQECTCTRCYR